MAGPMLIRGFLDELSVRHDDHRDDPAEGPAASNAIPFQHEGIWYFFVTAGEPNPETFLFYADAREGQWRYHPANPICSDASRAHSTGDPFSRR